MSSTQLLIDGLCFPEGPRWHEGRLFFSDMHAHQILAVDPSGAREVVAELAEDEPSGLGWLPDGRLLAVAMTSRRLLRLDSDGWATLADLAELASFHCNDMVVDRAGRAYVGNLGADVNAGAEPQPAELVLVTPDGDARIAADDLMLPNGCALTDDGRTLIVAESFGARLTAFDVADDGSLSGRRVWAELGDGAVPDGICLDAEGAVWVALPLGGGVARVREGGQILQHVAVEGLAVACVLGGPDRRTLYICAAGSAEPAETMLRRDGRIEQLPVEVAGAGLP